MEFSTKQELVSFLMDLQGQIENIQQTVDKLSPVVEDEPAVEEPTVDEEPTEKEVDEIDDLLQGE